MGVQLVNMKRPLRYFFFCEIRTLGLSFLLCAPFLLAYGQNVKNYDLLLKHQTIQLEENFRSNNYSNTINPNEIIEGKYFRLIQLYDMLNQTEKNRLKNYGVELLQYLPHRSYFVSIPNNFDFQKIKDFPIRNISQIESKWKESIAVQNQNFGDWALDGKTVNLSVFYFKNISKELVERIFRQRGIRVLKSSDFQSLMKIQVPRGLVKEISKFPFVSYIDQVSELGQPEAEVDRNLHRSNMLDAAFPTGRHYDGTGIKVLVRDDGAIGPHIDFKGRLHQNLDVGGSHGDAVAGVLGAAGNLDPTQRGAAKGAEIYAHFYEADFMNGVIDLHQNEGVSIMNSSYTDGCNSGYNDNAVTVDLQVYENPELLHVFSAGNAGKTNCDYGAGHGWGNITGGHKTGKNVLTVGNVLENTILQENSSIGPSTDGRIKPDLCANGLVWTTAPQNQYFVTNGTSYSAPATAGVAAQLYQAFDELNGILPEASLIKAILLNSATDLENEGPDFRTGWGLVNAFRAVKTIEEQRYSEGTIDQGQTNISTLTIPAGVRETRIMLYWADNPAAVNVSKALVNDLDLEMETPNGNIHQPLILDETPDSNSLSSVAIEGIDRLNNMEQIRIKNPVEGDYEYRINGFEIPFGAVKYYIVIEHFTDEITLTFPNGGESLVPGESQKIHWDAYNSTNDFLLEYSNDNGNTWSAIATVSGTLRSYDWEIPNLPTGQMKIRVSNNIYSDQSDELFSIAEVPQNLNAEIVCYDYVKLSWESVSQATEYEIFQLGDKYMESVGTTTNLSFEVPINDPTADNWFAVRALGNNEMKGRRTIAILHNSDILNCPTEIDIAANEILVPSADLITLCDAFEESIVFKIKNTGLTDQSDFEIGYQLGSQSPIIESYTSNLVSGDSIEYVFNNPLSISTSGVYNLKAWVNNSNDPAKYNDTIFIDFEIVISIPSPLDVVEDFESGNFPPTNWGIVNPDGSTTWETKEVIGSDGNPTQATWMNNYSYNGNGQEDELVTMTLDLSGVPLPVLSFDLAYVPFSQFSYDSMRVDVYTDCGEIFQTTIYGASYLELASLPNSQTNAWEPIQASDWKNETISLLDFVGETITLKFVNYNGFGNNLYLDNINVFNGAAFPIADFNFSKNEACESDSIIFGNLSISNTNATYLWDFGIDASPYSTSTEEGPHTIIYPSAGLRNVSLKITNPYGVDSIAKEIQIVDEPFANFSFTNDSGEVAFQNNSIGADSYFWDFGNGFSSTIENPVHTYDQEGVFTVSLTIVSALCDTLVTVSEDVVVLFSNVPEIDANFKSSIFPNPNNGNFQLNIKSLIIDDFQLQCVTLNGKVIDEVYFKNKIGEFTQNVDYQYLSKGVYFLKIKNSKSVVIKKLILK